METFVQGVFIFDCVCLGYRLQLLEVQHCVYRSSPELLLLLYLCHPLYVKVDSHNTFGCGIHRNISINK
jgi:hypothetical protein